MDKAKVSYFFDIKSGFDIIHLDPSINGQGFDDVMWKINQLYEYCEKEAQNCNRELIYEVGTEVHQYGAGSIVNFQNLVQKSKELKKVKFVVGDTGPYVKETTNVSSFSYGVAQDMIRICNENGMFLKEHNLDYTDYRTLSVHPYLGVHSANVAPEFGTEETRIFLCSLLSSGMYHEYEEFLELCYKSNKWKKWMIDQESPPSDYRQLAIICGHYLMENPRVKEITEELEKKFNYKDTRKHYLEGIILKYLTAFGWVK